MSAGTTGSARNLREDRGGAVVLIGVFVALALTGGLWFLIGIGDAIAFRETAQEATDAATFSSAVVHARSMNFIAAVNLVMLGVTVVYLVLAIIADLLAVALLTCTTVAFKPCSYGTYGAVPAALETAQQAAQQSADNYKSGVLRTTIKAGDNLQKLVAKAAPYTGSFAGVRVARRYDKDLVASTLGLSNAPQIDGGSGSAGTTNSDKKDEKRLGLPVVAKKASTLCDRVFANMKLGVMTQKNSGQDFSRGFPALDEAVSKAAKEAGTDRYCSGDFWGEDGPKAVLSSAQNGSDYMQVYGFMLGAKMKDKTHADHNVGALARTKKQARDQGPKSNVYLSQAEFFFDCTSTWDASGCNKDDGAMYSPMWKVRLRRMRSPVSGAALGAAALSIIGTSAASVAGQALGIPDADSAIQGVMDSAKGEVRSILTQQMSAFFNSLPLPESFPMTVPNMNIPNMKNLPKGVPTSYGNLTVPGYFH